MAPKKNPLNLNRLQLKTLTLLQELARDPRHGTAVDGGNVRVSQLPHPHGDHFHVGAFIAMASDATGFTNQAVWIALERKGLARAAFPLAIELTKAGLEYETGLRQEILHGSGH
ncbi:MAG TPA: hypothetical protein VEU47_05535 [Candidatus Cybelea sp.]|nr:hypothetical protein [Candidatus Cybelea sp.]